MRFDDFDRVCMYMVAIEIVVLRFPQFGFHTQGKIFIGYDEGQCR